jgi:translation initiation factor IF-2
VGDSIVAGHAYGRVRAMLDEHGENLDVALPSRPVQVLGFTSVPDAGDKFLVADEDRIARQIADRRSARKRNALAARTRKRISLDDLDAALKETSQLNLILKGDNSGTVEALEEALMKIEVDDDLSLRVIHRGVGGITKSDIQLASASKATIIGFNVRPDRTARELAEVEHVEIRTYEIIYQVLEDIERAMLGLLAPEFEEVVTGDAEVREVFKVPKIGAIAGCLVQNGTITRGSKVRFIREGTIIWKGAVSSLRRFKDDVREVQTGFECGIGLTDWTDLVEGDVIECFTTQTVSRSITA